MHRLTLAVLFSLILAAGFAFAQEEAGETEAAAVDTVQAMEEAPAESVLLGTDFGLGGRIGEAISKTPRGTGPGEIDPEAEPGFAGIPGAPDINYIIGVLWAIWVGWIFSTVGAFGGIMAGVGHITIYGLGDYARGFKQTNPTLNKLLTDSIRVSNQFLVGLSALVSSTNYARKGQLVLPLGLTLGLGSVTGALLIPVLTAGKINLSSYIGWFGVIVFVIGAYLVWQISPAGSKFKQEAKKAAAEFQKSVKEKSDSVEKGVKITKFSLAKIHFTFYGVEFKFSPLLPFIGGFFIASIASFLGIGGGFLYVPFMTSVVGLPMFLVAGTSALCVLIGMIVSIFTYMAIKGTFVSWSLVGVEMIGIFIGSMIGPRTQKYIPDKVLKIIFIILAVYVGLRYFSKGFFGSSWVPPY
ncbi:TSUP family transporter [bacterium]|nr:TSUP family transporter [bacterium]